MKTDEEGLSEARQKYGDIIDREHPVSRKHPPMSRTARAAQFAPFAALTGYDELLRESARETAEPTALSEERKEELSRTLRFLLSREPTPPATFTFFVYDRRKSGGAYISRNGRIARYHAQEESITLEDGTRIFLRDLTEIVLPAEGAEEP